ncbi:MAG: hypothetical protein IPN29_21195 [Saprospiraceae bacterium]|nr:hypothetical protein [Saprospiraceae bacterium]
MFIKLINNTQIQDFNIWAFNPDSELVRGSGIYVSKTGLSAYHHFLTTYDGVKFSFKSGKNHLQIFAEIAGNKKIKLIYEETIELDQNQVDLINSPNKLCLDWIPSEGKYKPNKTL